MEDKEHLATKWIGKAKINQLIYQEFIDDLTEFENKTIKRKIMVCKNCGCQLDSLTYVLDGQCKACFLKDKE